MLVCQVGTGPPYLSLEQLTLLYFLWLWRNLVQSWGYILLL